MIMSHIYLDMCVCYKEFFYREGSEDDVFVREMIFPSLLILVVFGGRVETDVRYSKFRFSYSDFMIASETSIE